MKIDYEYLSKIRRAVALYTNKKTSNILDGDFHSLHRGRSMEFDDLKEYMIGDDVHDIDWKSSSRMGTILVRRYMTDRRHNVMFICDRGSKMQGDTAAAEAKKELMLMTFGTLAYIVGRNGADYAMAYPGEGSSYISYFKSGTDHLEKLLYDYESKITSDVDHTIVDTLTEVLNTVRKKMIIFLLTDIEGLSMLSEGVIRSVASNHDLLIINVEDAFLTGDNVFDTELSRYERFFLSHSKALHEEEVRQREAIIGNASEICKRNRAALMTLSSEEDIIGRTVDLLERYRNGYYG
ncbi:DUF58 domain-containing protein [Butyrivibrio sp. FCS014]|uniref:DUF58 domain-containing protein n=1 Tax=Butyrivibrio sp. FCS014 TaxID=1408304 RepID=UPI0004642AC0|nr:DUF58 domain-containing protein [Butyrivibrio sp. FCS014]